MKNVNESISTVKKTVILKPTFLLRITAKFPGRCAETKKPIEIGDRIFVQSEEQKSFLRNQPHCAKMDSPGVYSCETSGLK